MVEAPKTIYRKDYTPTPYLIKDVALNFILNEDVSRVQSKLSVVPNNKEATPPPMVLNGRDDMKLVTVKVGGSLVAADQYDLTPKLLTLKAPPQGEFSLEIEVDIKPQENTLLEGLYKSGGNFSTQCEAEGFRGITYFYDRPDVMSSYTVRVEADRMKYPVLLSNGNLTEKGDLEGERHYAVWKDPFLKPCYLFALVAGNLGMYEDSFTTMSGKAVQLRIFVPHKDLDKVQWAMDSLKRSMKWDEERFGLEYDLDLFNIVAVDDFNMGAMENKSLNIFNTRLVLASPETTTDAEFRRIEGVIGHEYFHNWTGDRVTCRDWFQLTLKEGLTVFRDQEFTSDLWSRPVQRISDARVIRGSQFTQDQGAMAHPVRPDSYIKMDNFYTVTVYNKGAEVIRMYQTLLGVDGFRKGMDLYFQRHDGQAVTCDDFLAAMADANNEDLSSLAKWYGQSGTPELTIAGKFDAAANTYAITAKQMVAPTADQKEKIPVLIPIKMGLISRSGEPVNLQLKTSEEVKDLGTEAVLRFDKAEEEYVFANISEEPVPSVLRNFSAPVKLNVEGQTDEDLVFLLAHDTDSFNRWNAGQKLMMNLMVKLYQTAVENPGDKIEDRVASVGVPDNVIQAVRAVLMDESIDGAMASLAISLPGPSELIDALKQADPVLASKVRGYVRKTLATSLKSEFQKVVEKNSVDPSEPYVPDFANSAKRALKNMSLAYLGTLELPEIQQGCLKSYREASNMTDQIGALSPLLDQECPEREEALKEFEAKWKDNQLVMLKWLGMQASSSVPNNLEKVKALLEHSSFKITNPNCCYTLVGGFAASTEAFHAEDGTGYRFFADIVQKIDGHNFQVAARLANVFTSYKRFDQKRQGLIREVLQGMADSGKLSENTLEIVQKSLEC